MQGGVQKGRPSIKPVQGESDGGHSLCVASFVEAPDGSKDLFKAAKSILK